MILDTSALIAILFGEELDTRLLDAMSAAPSLAMSAATLTECHIVADRRLTPGQRLRVDLILDRFGVEIVPYDERQAAVARNAYRDFGKGSGHPAHLNMGDCFSYALAVMRNEPLLFVGDDFTHTDVSRAV